MNMIKSPVGLKRHGKKLVITFLGTKFENNHIYSEKEINRMIENHHLFEDTTLLRRELISRKILSRHDDGTKYWKIHEIIKKVEAYRQRE